ncbi:hypothetical protein ACIOTN_17220 [Glutamicibacter sp. NPDC087661]|uniref:hypothetical protein n=1 Tax=Glutamicibacter sp. NPDC087661 TaxID=3363996 RepID=UPI0037FAC12E
MNQIVALCPDHGTFPSRLVGGTINGLTLSGNIESCPICGKPSKTIEGTFNVGPDYIQVLQAPTWTKDVLAGLRDAVKNTKAQAELAATNDQLFEAIEQLTDKVGKIDSTLASFIQEQSRITADLTDQLGKSDRRGRILNLLSFLVALLTWAVPASDVADFTRTSIQPIIEQLAERYLK